MYFKTLRSTKYFAIAALSLGLTWTSCQKDLTPEQEEAKNLEQDLEFMNSLNSMTQLGESAIASGAQGKKSEGCAGLDIQTVGDSLYVVLSFGEECEEGTGVLTVKFKSSDVFNPLKGWVMVAENFTNDEAVFNGTQYVGEATENEAGNLYRVVEDDFRIHTLTGEEVMRHTARKMQERIAGADTPFILADDKVAITGAFNTETIAGYSRSGEVTEALIFSMECAEVVEGILNVRYERGWEFEVDYGNGDCDQSWTVTQTK